MKRTKIITSLGVIFCLMARFSGTEVSFPGKGDGIGRVCGHGNISGALGGGVLLAVEVAVGMFVSMATYSVALEGYHIVPTL